MKKKERKMPKKAKIEEESPMIVSNGPRLTEMEMKSLELHEARANMQAAIRDKLALQEQLLNVEYVKNRDVLRMKQREAEISMNAAKQDYNLARVAAEKRLDLSLNNYVVREDGSLRKITEIVGEQGG